MKKLISLLLAVSVMAMSSTSFAAYLGAAGQRNEGSWSDTTGGRNSNVLRDYNTASQLAVYRAGDTLTFTKGDVTFAAGDVVTFISSKVDATDLTSSTVMFIDQITVDSASPSFSYKIRSGLADGIYKMDIKVGSAAADTFYYAVGNPKIQVATVDENGTQAVVKDGVAYYFGAASIGTADVMFEQAGVAGYGFTFGENNYTFDAATYDNARAAQEINGTDNWWFTIAVDGVSEDSIPEAEAALVNE